MQVTRQRGDRLMRTGGAITAVGLALVVVAMLPLVVPSLTLPSWLWGSLLVVATGLGVLAAGFVVAGRERRREASTPSTN